MGDVFCLFAQLAFFFPFWHSVCNSFSHQSWNQQGKVLEHEFILSVPCPPWCLKPLSHYESSVFSGTWVLRMVLICSVNMGKPYCHAQPRIPLNMLVTHISMLSQYLCDRCVQWARSLRWRCRNRTYPCNPDSFRYLVSADARNGIQMLIYPWLKICPHNWRKVICINRMYSWEVS